MAKFDIFDYKERYATDDARPHITADGRMLTIEWVVESVSNVMAGHHQLCKREDCTSLPDPITGVDSGHKSCVITGPLPVEDTPKQAEAKEDQRVEKKLGKLGFDINRFRDAS
jgi:hypothetical protein